MSSDCQKQTGTCVEVVPSEICLRIVQDADTTFEFILTDGECKPVNITNDTVKLTVKDEPGGVVKLQKTNAPGEHSTPANGKTQFEIAHDDITDVLTVGETCWVYELRRIDASAKESVHITGNFYVQRSVGD